MYSAVGRGWGVGCCSKLVWWQHIPHICGALQLGGLRNEKLRQK